MLSNIFDKYSYSQHRSGVIEAKGTGTKLIVDSHGAIKDVVTGEVIQGQLKPKQLRPDLAGESKPGIITPDNQVRLLFLGQTRIETKVVEQITPTLSLPNDKPNDQGETWRRDRLLEIYNEILDLVLNNSLAFSAHGKYAPMEVRGRQYAPNGNFRNMFFEKPGIPYTELREAEKSKTTTDHLLSSIDIRVKLPMYSEQKMTSSGFYVVDYEIRELQKSNKTQDVLDVMWITSNHILPSSQNKPFFDGISFKENQDYRLITLSQFQSPNKNVADEDRSQFPTPWNIFLIFTQEDASNFLSLIEELRVTGRVDLLFHSLFDEQVEFNYDYINPNPESQNKLVFNKPRRFRMVVPITDTTEYQLRDLGGDEKIDVVGA